jgi:small-conductance mechanosensitive channel
MKKLLALVLLFNIAFAEFSTDSNLSQEQIEALERIKEQELKYMEIDERISHTKSVWLNAYNNYVTFNNVTKSLVQMKQAIRKLSKKRKTKEIKEKISVLETEVLTLKKQLELLPTQSKEPFNELLKITELPEKPEISNPFAIFTGFSFIKTITEAKEAYLLKEIELTKLQALLHEEEAALSNVFFLSPTNEWKKERDTFQLQMDAFDNALHVVTTTGSVYAQRIEDLEFQASSEIQVQFKSLFSLVIVIVVLIGMSFLFKMVLKKYIKDHERYYMINKIINFLNFLVIALILFVTYIDNVSYLITVLGFASAGIAIALKDWFMSILGWLVIVVGGSIHVGDRIRCYKNGMEYVGDVLDVSMLRITIMEDVTLTSYMSNRRAGRIVFIPNNYVFTEMISNYTHNSLKTVWDGIDIVVTFESNHKKASYIAKEITRKFSKGYTDITRKQLNKLRNQYSLKNTNVEPRIFTMPEPNGICISSWYLTNAYATLTLRSTITLEIVDAFNKADDIHIAYPTQTLNFGSKREIPAGLPPVEDL